MEETKWVVQINEELKGNGPSICDEKEQWKRPSIYKIPQSVTELNKKAYEPQAVSFGPYHKGKDHLHAMEDHKHRALIHYLKRCNKSIELVFQRMDQVVQELKDSYRPLDPIWDQDKNMFLQLMIVDGCFLLEILRASDCVPSDYAENDPVFSGHGKLYVMPYIKRDMLMLENQLPMLVLHTLIEIESDGQPQDDELLNKQMLRFLSPTTTIRGKMGKCMHALDVYRKGLVMQGPTHPTRIVKSTTHRNCCYRWFTADSEYSTTDEIIRSATELHEAGIWFRKSSSHSLQDVSFDRGILRLPTMVVDDTTEPMFLNLMAFERLHVGAGNEVTSYVFFIDTIIDDEIDVALLHRRGILVNALGCHKDVAKLFNSLSKDITADRQGVLDVVQMSLSNYCKKPWNKWRANLIHTYFRNPWAMISLVAAMLLFALTIVQTVYAILDFYQSNNGDGSPPATKPPRLPRLSSYPPDYYFTP
ncbi:hypothetical protein HN51_024067 [Arachis hypogaea]|uniref:Uncharacterized protein n=2 Tax=Arachis TaxID=3817 RepID=A0A445C4K6_ARAHY|nr:UPF0481 protein At3g47200-like [Arachis duranensis]XP_025608965.1 UPF0481 protein At3g47200-like [Arachis hypogaea]QHO27066.1 UPF0481 protein [Arachis hypogaea]RYR45843.1 hypothetical protein Ahy_A07g031623 [Arachis hypogaea]